MVCHYFLLLFFHFYKDFTEDIRFNLTFSNTAECAFWWRKWGEKREKQSWFINFGQKKIYAPILVFFFQTSDMRVVKSKNHVWKPLNPLNPFFLTSIGFFCPIKNHVFSLRYGGLKKVKNDVWKPINPFFVPHMIFFVRNRIFFYSVWNQVFLTQFDTKGRLILKCPFGVFKSPKKPTKFFQDFCPSLKKEVKSKSKGTLYR